MDSPELNTIKLERVKSLINLETTMKTNQIREGKSFLYQEQNDL